MNKNIHEKHVQLISV